MYAIRMLIYPYYHRFNFSNLYKIKAERSKNTKLLDFINYTLPKFQ